MSLTTGPYIERLVALRDLLAQRLVVAAPRDVAPLAKQLADVDARIEDLSVPEETDGVDEITQRRLARRAEAKARKSS